MKELILELLRIALIALILFPIIGTLGCTWINAYFSRLTKYQVDIWRMSNGGMTKENGDAEV